MKSKKSPLLSHTRQLLTRDQRNAIRRYLSDPRERAAGGWPAIHDLPVSVTDGNRTPLWLALFRVSTQLGHACSPAAFGSPQAATPDAWNLARALRWAAAQPRSTAQGPWTA